MPKTLPEIIYNKDKITPIIDARSAHYHIPYFKGEDYFNSIDSYTAFIKGCEKAVRQNDRYSKYISYLKTEVQLDHCQVLKDINDNDYVYFVHSYYLKAEDESIVKAVSYYGDNVIHASVESGNVFACQFHPEKSGEVGLKILKNFISL